MSIPPVPLSVLYPELSVSVATTLKGTLLAKADAKLVELEMLLVDLQRQVEPDPALFPRLAELSQELQDLLFRLVLRLGPLASNALLAQPRYLRQRQTQDN
jgi:hypothetical protein